MNKFNNTHDTIEIITVSLDNDKQKWLKFIKENSIDLIDINAPKGWDETIASNYFIYTTPSMFLLDTKKKILGKPINLQELKNF